MTSTFGNWSMPYWSGLSSAQRSAPQLYQDWLRGQQLAAKNSPLNQVKGIDVSECDIIKLAGQDVVEADQGFPGWQFLVAEHVDGKLMMDSLKLCTLVD